MAFRNQITTLLIIGNSGGRQVVIDPNNPGQISFVNNNGFSNANIGTQFSAGFEQLVINGPDSDAGATFTRQNMTTDNTHDAGISFLTQNNSAHSANMGLQTTPTGSTVSMLADSHTGLTVNGDFGSNSDPNSVSIQYSTPNVLGHVPMIYAQNVAGVTTALKLVWQIIEAVISIPNGTPGISAVQNFPAAFPAGFSYIIGFINQRNPLGNANLNSPCFVPVSGSQYQVSLANAGAATNTTLDILAMAGYA